MGWLWMYIECWLFWVYFRKQWKENVETLIVDMQVFPVDILHYFIVKANGTSRRKPPAGKRSYLLMSKSSFRGEDTQLIYLTWSNMCPKN